MANNSETFANAIQAALVREKDPIHFKTIFGQAQEEVRDALQILLQEAEVVFGTPVAVIELAQHHPHWMPALLVVDEAGRVPLDQVAYFGSVQATNTTSGLMRSHY